MDDPQNKRPLADDPNFLASLSDLDRGLSTPDVVDDAVEPRRVAPPTPAASAPPPRPAVPSTSGAIPPVAVPPGAPGQPAPLLDLFPPPPTTRERARGPAIGGAPPPRIRRTPAMTAEAPVAAPDLTYEPFYGLNEKPFGELPDPKFIYHSTSLDAVAQQLIDAIGRRDEIVLVTGEKGIGKTTLCRSVINQLDRRTLTSFVTDPSVSVEELLKNVLVDFGVIAREDAARGHLATAARNELTDTLREFATSLAPLQAAAVVMIDDADGVANDVFALIRDLAAGARRQATLHFVLAGQPALLRRRELHWIDRRIAVRCRLEPLPAEEVGGYVGHRLAVAGASARVEFDDGAIAKIHALTGGVPARVNVVCDRALTLGHQAAASVIDDRLVTAAAGDLNLGAPRSERRWLVRTVALGLAFALLMLLGAAAAAWVFRDAMARAVMQWAAIPPVPAPPIQRLLVPLAAIPAPAEDEIDPPAEDEQEELPAEEDEEAPESR